MQSLNRNAISVKPSPLHGWGVFADQVINAGDVIEECHLLLMDDSIPELDNYLFGTFKSKIIAKYVLPLGYGAIYNHSDVPNSRYIFDDENTILIFCADRVIGAGEEILVSYGMDWFGSRNIVQTQSSTWFKLKFFIKTYKKTVRSVLVTLALILLLKFMQDSSFLSVFTY